MKYEIEIYQHRPVKTIELEANSREYAYRKALAENPQWMADSISEIGEDDKYGECHILAGACENCDKPLFDGDEYGMTLDDYQICSECGEGMTTSVEL